MKLLVLAAALAVAALASPAAAQMGDPPKYEFRGAWVATVTNLDWPKSTAPATQQSSLIRMFDEFQAAGLNAVFFQVRPAGDAFYESELEPWSHWLTGQQGRAPEPYYDPLAFAIEEAHRRGMELHAWLNPYRMTVGSYTLAESHPARRNPEWVLDFPAISRSLLDPGLPEVRDYVTEVVMDIVRRYPVDGIHFDDYFYPYPSGSFSGITNEDDATFAEHNRGFTNRGNWRRDNINLFVAQVGDSIRAVRPEVKYGVSPFGIWRNGVPSGIVGLDAYNTIYADPVAWLQAQDLDYVLPQLYWAFGGGQDYAKLAPWWASQRNDRHFYVGHGLYKADNRTFSGGLFAADEVPRQVRFNRENEGIHGSVFFRAQNISDFNSRGITDSLKTDLFRYPALTPPMDWKATDAPATPEGLGFEWDDEFVTLRWNPAPEAEGAAAARFYAVYRIQAEEEPDYEVALADPRNLYVVTGDTLAVDRPRDVGQPYYYVVTAVSANSIESAATGAVVLEGRAVSTEPAAPTALHLGQNYPNPFADGTVIAYALEEPGTVSLRVYNLLGQEVATLLDAEPQAAGLASLAWEGTRADGRLLPSGTYFYTLEVDGHRETRTMTIVR